MLQWTLLCQSNLPMIWLSPDLLQSQTTQLGNLGLLLSQTITIDSQVSLESFTHYLFIFIHQSGQDWRHWNPTYNMTPFYLALSHISGSSVMTYSPFPTTTRLTWWCFHPCLHLLFICWRHFITSEIFLIPFLPWPLLPVYFGYSPEHLLPAVLPFLQLPLPRIMHTTS